MPKILINQSFSNEDISLFDKLEKREFESQEVLDLKVEAEAITHDTEINELLSYPLIEKIFHINFHIK